MRIGQNPAKSIREVAQPQRVTVALITYIPFLGGYYAQSLDVLKVCLQSIVQNTDQPYDLLVFDNASCPEVRAYLQGERDAGRIQYLVLSEKNIGKAGAWNFIFGAAPGEYVAYADSDVYFYPGWLSAMLRIAEEFPNVGMVTGLPLLTPTEYATATVEWAERTPDVQVERGALISWEDFWRHTAPLGSDESRARQFYAENPAVRLTYRGQTAYAGAGHFQFLAPRRVLQAALPFPTDRPMGNVRALDVTINEMGYLRLSTPQWWVQHLGNTLDGWEGAASPSGAAAPQRGGHTPRGRGLWGFPPIRRALSWLNAKTFDLLYRS
ncbi:MAG: hypothetical protein Fur0018_06880 [Anaerolineales bacterium]